MNDVAKVEYAGIEIVYWEQENKWKFTLRGRERSADTLLNAKAAIDKPAPKEEKPFTRIKAILMRSYSAPIDGEITSIAESPAYSNRTEVWFTSTSRGRRKEELSDLREDTPENRALLKEADEIDAQAYALKKKAEAIRAKLTKVVLP